MLGETRGAARCLGPAAGRLSARRRAGLSTALSSRVKPDGHFHPSLLKLAATSAQDDGSGRVSSGCLPGQSRPGRLLCSSAPLQASGAETPARRGWRSPLRPPSRRYPLRPRGEKNKRPRRGASPDQRSPPPARSRPRPGNGLPAAGPGPPPARPLTSPYGCCKERRPQSAGGARGAARAGPGRGRLPPPGPHGIGGSTHSPRGQRDHPPLVHAAGRNPLWGGGGRGAHKLWASAGSCGAVLGPPPALGKRILQRLCLPFYLFGLRISSVLTPRRHCSPQRATGRN